MLTAGDKALDFTLMSDKNEKVSLSQFIGKSNVVLYFYPKDNTPGCTNEACSFRDSIEAMQSSDLLDKVTFNADQVDQLIFPAVCGIA